MTTYICKCGRTFQKSTEAGTTGFRMPDYGPAHECYGCPFVCKVATWDPTKQADAVQNHECRGSQSLRYDTEAALSLGDKCVGRIYSLDLDFLHRVRDYADTLDGIDPDRYAFTDRPADYGDDGRFKLTIYPAQNNKGIAAKQQLFDTFFRSDGTRKDVTPEQEKEIVLKQIEEAKAVAQGMEAPVETGVKYYHNGLAYFAGKREDNGKYTVFLDDADNLGPDTLTEVATIPDFDTFEEAQNALDGLALKRGFSTECSTPEEKPEMEQQEYYSLGADPHGGPVVSLPNDAEQKDASADQSGLSADENPPSDNDTGDSVNDGAEQPPQSCDWKNASGEDDGKEDSIPDDEQEPLPEGSDLSLRLPSFNPVFDTADDSLRDMARTLKTKYIESGELAVKIVLNNYNGILKPDSKKCTVTCNLKPAKVSTPIHFSDDLEIAVEQDGRVIVPADREHQLNFDEIQPGQREYPPAGGTAKVDGKTGIVEDYQEDGKEPEDPPTSDDTTNPVAGDDSDPDEKPDELYSCDNYDCPFYAPPDSGDSGCGFDGKVYPSNVSEAVETYGCTRPEVLQAYSEDHPVENESEESSNE